MTKVNAYTPFSRDGNLGKACNEIMERLDIDEWALFLDHDVCILDNSFWESLFSAIDSNPDAGAITCFTNYILNKGLIAENCPPSNDMLKHREFAKSLFGMKGKSLSEIDVKTHLSGFCFATSKRAWLKAGNFLNGFGNVDISYGDCLRRSGLKILRMDGVYVYHMRITNGYKNIITPSIKTNTHVPCEFSSIPQAKPSHLKPMEGLKTSLILACRNWNHEDIFKTIRSFRENGIDEVVVVDDFSDVPVKPSVGADIIHRTSSRIGSSGCLEAGCNMSTGDFIIFSDANCRVRFGDLKAWSASGMSNREFLCASSTSFSKNDIFYGGDSSGNGNAKITERPKSVFGSVYGFSRTTYEGIAKTMPVVDSEFNSELTRRLNDSVISIVCHPWFVIGNGNL